jgi:hypothetical protein
MLIEMIKKYAFIILEDSSLEVSMDFGVKAGLVAGNLGMLKVALKEFTEVKGKIDRLNFVLIMVSLTLNLYTLTVTAENHM